MRRTLTFLTILALAIPALARATAEPYRVCGHVPITGAAPIPHHEDRFGQFYFDYVNAELGGVDGHPVEFRMIDDRFFQGGAREALRICQEHGAQLLVGPWGHDQIVTAARWAEEHHLPYLHGSVAHADVDDLTWSTFLSPTDEDLMHDLARTMVSAAPPDAVFGMVRIDSPFYEPAAEALEGALNGFEVSLATVVTAPKDERQFSRVWSELQQHGVTHVVLHVTVLMAINMIDQRPLGYDPVLGSAEPSVSSSVLTPPPPNRSRQVDLVALHDPAPPFPVSGAPDPAWSDEFAEFQRIFETYSPEDSPLMNSFDWDSYVRAKQIHRFLDALDEDLSPEHIRSMFSAYSEAGDVSPACALDFGATPGVGAHAAHVFVLEQGRWNLRAACAQDGTDTGGPTIACEDQVPLASGVLRCHFTDAFSGVLGASADDEAIPFQPDVSHGVIAECPSELDFEWNLTPGVHRLTISASDCAGNDAEYRTIVVSV